MAAYSLPSPGTKLGPCVVACAHVDCAESRRMAETPCRFCPEVIGYERRFYIRAADDSLVHASCEERKVVGK